MLVLTRKPQQRIQIGDKITITIVRVTGQSVRVGIEAPQDVRVVRGELASKPDKGSAAPEPLPELVASTRSASPAAPSQSSQPPAPHTGPLASRCRNRLLSVPHALSVSQPCPIGEDRRRVPGASFTPTIRRPQRLGPASLGAMAGRMR
jgi:carbon storage regulator CsrA